MNRFVREHCHSPFVSTIEGSFKIPHHLAQTDARYADIEFDVVFYPLAGTDLRRISSPWCYPDYPDNPLSSRRLKQCIRDLTLGLAALHKIGVVHGGERANSVLVLLLGSRPVARHPPWKRCPPRGVSPPYRAVPRHNAASCPPGPPEGWRSNPSHSPTPGDRAGRHRLWRRQYHHP
jgi:hypothetical protein